MPSLKGIVIYHAHAIKSGLGLNIFTSNQLIHLYSKYGRVQEARKVFDEMPERNVFSWNAIISAYIKAQNLEQSREMFDSAYYKDVVTYNSMLTGYVNADGCKTKAIELFKEMQSGFDGIRIDEFSLTTMLNLTAKLAVISYGMQLHSFMVKTANDLSAFAVSSLIDMYSKCGCFREAWFVFYGCWRAIDMVSKNAMVAACCREGKLEMAIDLFWREPQLNDVISWNTMISGFAQNGYEEEALKLFGLMAENGLNWNEHTVASVFSACAGLKSFKVGKEVHALVLKKGLNLNPFICSGIIDVYCKCESMRYAELAYATMGTEKSFAITSMIAGHSSQGNMVKARNLFNSLAEKSSVVWTALFTAYLKSQQSESVFELFSEFREKKSVVPDPLIIICVLSSCAIKASVDLGKQVHSYILRSGIEMNKKLNSALVDMYSKCGNITYAENIFQGDTYRDSVLYNVIIAGYAHNGLEYKAIQLFKEMLEGGIRPDVVTFLALLSACRHRGLMELGEKFFDSMVKDYNILPEVDHYACMIDLYGKANEIDKAIQFMKKIPIELDTVIWGAVLNACRINKNTELAKVAEEKLLETEGASVDRYVQLANVYAAEGNWDAVGRIRKQMRGNKIKKIAGCSWLYVENRIHIFTSGDRTHSKSDVIYSVLACLTDQILEKLGHNIEVVF